jgi:hypothetical protein
MAEERARGDDAVLLPGAARREVLEQEPPNAETRSSPQPFDPNVVIAGAFAAAGLPMPEIGPPNAGQPVAPGPIIVSALKAAGLMKH